MTMPNARKLKVAFLAGTLAQGGAERQLVYMVRALLDVGVDVRVYSLTRGEYYESSIQTLGAPLIWIGQYSSPLFRTIALMVALRNFKPHVLHATHFYTNLYVGLVAPLYNALGIGSIRSNLFLELESNPFWGKSLFNIVGSLIANSQAASRNAVILGLDPKKIQYLPNVIDLAAFDRKYEDAKASGIKAGGPTSQIVIAAVGRLETVKRFDRFIIALSVASREMPELSGIIIGDGPEMDNLKTCAQQVGLSEEKLIFLGRRDDVPNVLRQADIFVLTSDYEGFPNVLLEAMAARLPVITTPAGDASILVQNGVTGYVVYYDDIDKIVEHMLNLARSSALRSKLGEAGRIQVEQDYGINGLADNLLNIYQNIAKFHPSYHLDDALTKKPSDLKSCNLTKSEKDFMKLWDI